MTYAETLARAALDARAPRAPDAPTVSGRRAMDDPRNQLFREFTRLLRGLMPRVFVMENVTGLVKGKMKAVFAEILQELKACGYQVTAGVINAAYLGVPQARERVIFIGCREDLGIIPTLPAPQTRFTTVAQALVDLPERSDGPGRTDAPKWFNVWARVQPGHDYASVHPKGNLFNSFKVNPDRPCGTITKTISSGNGGPGLYHWKHPRLLNIEELTRLGASRTATSGLVIPRPTSKTSSRPGLESGTPSHR